jgi:magnesium transporter
LRRPLQLARTLRAIARRRPDQVEDYLDRHAQEWTALVDATPGDAADILEELGEVAASELLAELTPSGVAEVLEELRPDLAASLIEEMTTTAAAAVLEEMTPEGAVDVLEEIEDAKVSQLLDTMGREAAEDIRELLVYPPDTAGGLMTTDIAKLPVGMTAGEAIERIRQLHDELEHLSYVYVIDDADHLVGVISFRDLVFNPPQASLKEAMIPDPLAVQPETDREEVAEIIQRYHLFGLPVVDHDRILIGMVSTESVIDAIQQEASEDFAAAVGAGVEETVYTTVGRSLRSRLPWIVVDLILSVAVVAAISPFNKVIGAFTVLAALMPVVARIGGDAGSQSLAVVIRSLATEDIPSTEVSGVMMRQVAIGAANGVAVALLSGILGATVQAILGGPEPLLIGLVMAVAAWVNLVIAGLAGAGIPLLLRRLGADPALASSLFLTTCTDLVGFAGFLGVAAVVLL